MMKVPMALHTLIYIYLHICIYVQKLDDGWPESEKGDCQAIPSKIELSKSHDFFVQSIIE